jgi:hypothetical protein
MLNSAWAEIGPWGHHPRGRHGGAAAGGATVARSAFGHRGGYGGRNMVVSGKVVGGKTHRGGLATVRRRTVVCR